MMARMASIASGLQVAGLIWAVVGVVVAVPFFGLTSLGLLPVFIGGVLLVVGALAAPSSTSMSLSARLRRGLPHLSAVVVGLGGLAGAWALRGVGDVDVTRARVNTLAEESVQVATALTTPTTVVAFADDDESRTLLRTLVARYSAVNPRIALELRSVRVAADIERAEALGLAELLPLGGPNVAVVTGGRDVTDGTDGEGPPVRLRLTGQTADAEQQLTNALRRSQERQRAKIYVVAGHGEPAPNDESAAGLSRLRDRLRARDVDLVPLPIAQLPDLPDDVRAILWLAGTVQPRDVDVARLQDALAAGANIVAAINDEASSVAMRGLLASVGVEAFADVVVDESPFSSLLGGAELATGQTQLAHPVTRPLRGAMTHFSRAQVLALTPTPAGTTPWTTTPLVSTGGDARARGTGAAGPLPLVVVAVEGGDGRRGDRHRAVVCADADFFTNGLIGLGANLDLAENLLLWSVQADDDLTIRPRRKSGSLIFLTPSARETLSFWMLVLVPATLLSLGAAWSARRRSR